MRLGVMDCITLVKNKINPKTKESLLNVEKFEKRTKKAKQMLERVCKGEVIGYRVPNVL